MLVWAFTMGSTKFWLFPNLNEDLGILESFKPLYTIKRKKTKTKHKTKETSDKQDTGSSQEPPSTDIGNEGEKGDETRVSENEEQVDDNDTTTTTNNNNNNNNNNNEDQIDQFDEN